MKESKPHANNIKDLLINKLAIKFNLSPKIIESIVDSQIQGIHRALQSDSVFSLELSGFGKWLFNHKKAIKKYEKNLSKIEYFSSKATENNISEASYKSYMNKLTNTQMYVNSLEQKIKKCLQLQNMSEQP